MSFYYEATTNFLSEGEHTFYCRSQEELSKKDVIVVEFGGDFVTAIVQKPIDELNALLSKRDIRDILVKVEVKEYLQAKENKIKQLLLVEEMEEKCKEVKMLETLKKYSDRDSEMKSMYEAYLNLNEQ